MKNLVLVEDHVIVRSGLKELIEKLGPYKIAYEYDNGRDFTQDIANYTGMPDLVLLDLDMPVLNGEATLKWLQDNSLSMPVLVLTLSENETQIVKLFRYGARGYLHKNCTASTLKQAIEDILHTGYFHSEMLTKALLSPPTAEQPDKRTLYLSKLTDRERTFLNLVCDEQEYTYEQIAGLMHISPRTLDGYRESVFEKLQVKSKTGLVLFAIKNKLLELE